MRLAWLALVGAACAAEGPPDLPGHPCGSTQSLLEVAPPGGDYGQPEDGADLWCGNPPQGGAPFTPFRLRVTGPEALEEGVTVEMTAMDRADGSELAYTTLPMGLTCANVGDSAGTWVGSEAHMRYGVAALDELLGLQAEVIVRVTAVGTASFEAEQRWDVTLVAE